MVKAVAERVKAPFTATNICSSLYDFGLMFTFVVSVVTSLDKTLYDNYLCLVTSNKQ